MEGAEHAKSECEVVGEGMADIAGVGIFVGFIGQSVLSLLLAYWVFFMAKDGSLDMQHEEGSIENKIERKRLEFVSNMLVVGNDIQMVLGISYMVNVFAIDKLDLYHLHLVFDVVSFVGVSNAAAMVCWSFCAAKLDGPNAKVRHSKSGSLMAYFTPRHRASYMYAAMFLGLTILLLVRLNEWAPDAEPGRCYHSRLITNGNDHPGDDKAYVAITAIWMLGAMASAVFLNPRRRRYVLVSASLQFPVHLYMALALRSENQGKLEGEEVHENAWDFGQTTATVLLGVAVTELMIKARQYYYFEHNLRKDGLLTHESTKVTSTQSREAEVEDAPESIGLRDRTRQSSLEH